MCRAIKYSSSLYNISYLPIICIMYFFDSFQSFLAYGLVAKAVIFIFSIQTLIRSSTWYLCTMIGGGFTKTWQKTTVFQRC